MMVLSRNAKFLSRAPSRPFGQGLLSQPWWFYIKFPFMGSHIGWCKISPIHNAIPSKQISQLPSSSTSFRPFLRSHVAHRHAICHVAHDHTCMYDVVHAFKQVR